ncbi:MAG: hypothetical protein AAGI12_02090 [Pseudomonadota bacterium]
MRKISLLLLVTVAACGPSLTPSEQRSLAYQQMSTSDLWQRQETTTVPQALFMIEAELGTRGEMDLRGFPLGTRTAGSVGRSIYSRPPENTKARYECADFASDAEAQRAFLAAGGPVRDPHKLDSDGDGFACAWGTTLRSNIDGSRAAAQADRS